MEERLLNRLRDNTSLASALIANVIREANRGTSMESLKEEEGDIIKKTFLGYYPPTKCLLGRCLTQLRRGSRTREG